MNMPRNLKEFTIPTTALSIPTGEWMGLDLLKSIISSFVFATLRKGYCYCTKQTNLPPRPYMQPHRYW